jgi:hypothetical protein
MTIILANSVAFSVQNATAIFDNQAQLVEKYKRPTATLIAKTISRKIILIRLDISCFTTIT